MEFDNRVILGDCLEVLQQLPDNAFDSCVTDPPYGLGTKEPTVEEIISYLQGEELDTGGDFMGKRWSVPSVAVWREVYRVLKPGAHVLAFGGTRTFDLISLGLRAAGFENRDTIADDHPALQWKHGQGFPKSLNVSKAIDAQLLRGGSSTKQLKQVNDEDRPGPGRLRTGNRNRNDGFIGEDQEDRVIKDDPATELGHKWDGYGTALKPAWEPILVFRKPLEGTVADNVLEHGTGALNIDATRVGVSKDIPASPSRTKGTSLSGSVDGSLRRETGEEGGHDPNIGRWPPNAVMTHAEGYKRLGTRKVRNPKDIHSTRGSDVGNKMFGQGKGLGRPVSGQSVGYVDEDGTEEVEAWECVDGCPIKALDEQTGMMGSGSGQPKVSSGAKGGNSTWTHRGGTFREGQENVGVRDFGDSGGASRFFPQFEGQELVEVPFFYTGKATKKGTTLDGEIENKHPTKKPLKLMAWLVKLVTQKGGLVLDPYCGSGSTLHAAVEEGMRFTGIDSWDYAYEVATKRMEIVCQKAECQKGQEDLFALAMGGYEDA